ncbi:MAG: acyl-CoA dehydrogenase family protein, partial [Pseudomonadota bacterium]|nr:acyl-CoA dehydrogenase family protein [Pseudomonadota bacterium]
RASGPAPARHPSRLALTTKVQRLQRLVGLEGLADGLRARITDHLMYSAAFKLTVQRSTEEAKAGQEVGHTASIMKYAAAKMNQEKSELLVEALGTDGLGWDGDGFAEDAKKATRGWLRSKGNSIEGGTSEINLNVVAKRVLGLREHQ